MGLVLFGCGEGHRGGYDESAVINEREIRTYETFGIKDIKIYANEQNTQSNRLPITITDGESFAVKIPAEYRGKRVFVEIDGVVREIEISSGDGETIFID